MRLFLAVDNSTKIIYTQITEITDYGYDRYFDHYCVCCVNAKGENTRYSFDTLSQMYREIQKIKDSMHEDAKRLNKVKLVISNPPTWLDLAIRRVNKSSLATKKHRGKENKKIVRDIKR